jgi:hypothetical protein
MHVARPPNHTFVFVRVPRRAAFRLRNSQYEKQVTGFIEFMYYVALQQSNVP